MADVSRELLILGMLRRAPLSAYDNHAFNRVRAEQRFLAESIAQLRDAKWSPSWTSDDGLIDADRRLQARPTNAYDAVRRAAGLRSLSVPLRLT